MPFDKYFGIKTHYRSAYWCQTITERGTWVGIVALKHLEMESCGSDCGQTGWSEGSESPVPSKEKVNNLDITVRSAAAWVMKCLPRAPV